MEDLQSFPKCFGSGLSLAVLIEAVLEPLCLLLRCPTRVTVFLPKLAFFDDFLGAWLFDRFVLCCWIHIDRKVDDYRRREEK